MPALPVFLYGTRENQFRACISGTCTVQPGTSALPITHGAGLPDEPEGIDRVPAQCPDPDVIRASSFPLP